MRPTADKLRGTLFNVLAKRVATSRFLDLCAGSGAVGIEALSRGAAHVTFVDRSRKLCALIESSRILRRALRGHANGLLHTCEESPPTQMNPNMSGQHAAD